jgi:RNA polymerase sigma-70 factor (ECF subfamily)
LDHVRPVDDDGQLIRRHLEGDPRAFEALVLRHQTRVYNLCLRMLGNPEDARDAAQDAFLAALRKLSSFRGDAAFTTWMHRVTVNACHDLSRKNRRQPMLRLASDRDDREVEPGPPIPDHADAVAGASDAARALLDVPEEFRAALVLADVQDLPYEEIASILGVAIGTVKSRVHRGRIALAKAMGATPPTREPRALSRPSEEQA